jgi:hypothetical protein
MIQGWNTGHPGGVATIHCNSAPDALERLEDLLIQGGYTPVPRQIAKAVNIVVFIGPVTIETTQGLHAKRRLQDIVRVVGVEAGGAGSPYIVERPFAAAANHRELAFGDVLSPFHPPELTVSGGVCRCCWGTPNVAPMSQLV